MSSHLLVRALRGEPVERAPVWAMRQAGRWDPEFARIRSGLGFYEFSADVERSTAATLCPRRFGVDAIILFYDITTLPMSMGLPFTLVKDVGPQPDRPVRTAADLERLTPEPHPDSYLAIRQLLKRVKEELAGDLPVIAFAGSPFTVATYCIGTGKDINATRSFAAENPGRLGRPARAPEPRDRAVFEHADRRRGRTCTNCSTRGPACSTRTSTSAGRNAITRRSWRARRGCHASCL